MLQFQAISYESRSIPPLNDVDVDTSFALSFISPKNVEQKLEGSHHFHNLVLASKPCSFAGAPMLVTSRPADCV
jgi:hypothetical protein